MKKINVDIDVPSGSCCQERGEDCDFLCLDQDMSDFDYEIRICEIFGDLGTMKKEEDILKHSKCLNSKRGIIGKIIDEIGATGTVCILFMGGLITVGVVVGIIKDLL